MISYQPTRCEICRGKCDDIQLVYSGPTGEMQYACARCRGEKDNSVESVIDEAFAAFAASEACRHDWVEKDSWIVDDELVLISKCSFCNVTRLIWTGEKKCKPKPATSAANSIMSCILTMMRRLGASLASLLGRTKTKKTG